MNACKAYEKPRLINTDKAAAYGAAILQLKNEGKLSIDTEPRQVKYLNNIIEQDHGKLKRLIKPTLGFKSMKTAYATIKGFEVMRALKKGQAKAFQIQTGIKGEVRLVERAFGLGADMLPEVFEYYKKDIGSGPVNPLALPNFFWFIVVFTEIWMSDLFWLSEAQMAMISPYFPLAHGVPRADDRKIISGIIFIIRRS